MQTGIVGLPQVGKTTLFRILTRAHMDEKSARSATHIGVARVPEPRIDQLAALYKNHGQFVSQWGQSAQNAVKGGFLLQPDANELKNSAATSNIGK